MSDRLSDARSAAKRGKATAAQIRALAEEARRQERRSGLTGQDRIKTEKQISRMTKQEQKALAKQYTARASYAEKKRPLLQAQAAAKKGRATAAQVKILASEARRQEKKAGMHGGRRVKSQKQLEKMTPARLRALAKEYQRRAEAAQRAQQGAAPYDMSARMGAWDRLMIKLEEEYGISIESGTELYEWLKENSLQIDTGFLSEDEQFQELFARYQEKYDIPELDDTNEESRASDFGF